MNDRVINVPKIKFPKKVISLIIVAIIALIVLFCSTVTIQSGTVGVVSRFGAAQDNPLQPGFHFIIPFITTVHKMDVKTQKIEADCTAASKDLQTIATKVAINFKIDSATAPNLYRSVNINYQDTIIRPAIQEAVKSVTARFSAEELISKRQDASTTIAQELSEKISKYGITIELFNILNLDFSEEFNKAIEAKQTAQQAALKAEQDLTRVKIEAQQKLEQAKAEADATRATADAEAYAIQKMQEQLAKDPRYIDYYKLQKWDGKLPQVEGSSTPIIDMRDSAATSAK